MKKLSEQSCKPVSSSDHQLDEQQIQVYLKELQQLWSFDKSNNSISRDFQFNHYYETIAFVNAAAWIAHQQDHHPEMLVGYNHCRVSFTTHSINGLSVNDFICASKINEIKAH